MMMIMITMTSDSQERNTDRKIPSDGRRDINGDEKKTQREKKF